MARDGDDVADDCGSGGGAAGTAAIEHEVIGILGVQEDRVEGAMHRRQRVLVANERRVNACGDAVFGVNSTHAILDGEMDIHRSYMARLGITPEEAEHTKQALDNLSYTSYMLRVAYEEGQAEVAASILSCALSYEAIARQIVAEHPEADKHPFYGEWVSGYVSDSYHEENESLVVLVDRLAADYNEAQLAHLSEIFTACSRYEKAFWDMAWEMRK